jgi:F-type H+-transporting ATPase subunit a
MKGTLKRVIFILSFTILVVFGIFANEPLPASDTLGQEKEQFSPGTFILEHIADAYSWHILTIPREGEEKLDIALPLPVIVYSKEKGWNFFMSSRFEHGHAEHNGFFISHEGSNEGKVVERFADGSIARPIDLSIKKNVFAIFLSIGLMLWIFLSVAARYKKSAFIAPKGLQGVLEPLIIFIRDDIARPNIGDKRYERYMPYLLTLFFFIWINNMMGLIPFIPGGANVTGNISVTMALALITFLITTFSGNKHYWLDIFWAPGVPWWLKVPIPLMPVIEFASIIIRPFVLMVRLFANITAGHIIALAFFSLIFIFGQMQPAMGLAVSPLSIAFTIFMFMLELLVAFIQAFVFTLLSALYFGMATAEHH